MMNKSLWLIGASSGIGQSLAVLLAKRGWQVAISARSADRLHAMASKQEGLQAFPLDVTNKEQVKSIYEQIKARMGEVSYVLFNAGDYMPMPLEEYDIELFERLVRVNYLGAVYVIDAVRDDFCKRKYGQILLTASLAAYRGLPRSAPYSASKAATLSLAESMHLEFKQQGVLLRIINPGFVKTPLTDKNNFDMPFLIDSDQAAQSIFRELELAHFEIRFPKRFALIMKLLSLLPYRIYFWLTRRSL